MAKIIRIDTSDNKQIIIQLVIDGKIIESFLKSTLLKSDACLPLINDLLNKNKVDILEVDEIEVNQGPGSFTGLRVGASIANALGYLLKIPVNNKMIGELVNPIYNN